LNKKVTGNMQIGYVRVSTNDQNTDLQRQALERAGCEQIFEEKMSGTVANRPALRKLLKALNEGDTLVVWKLDRLGRSMRNLVLLVDELRLRGIHFKSLTDSIDTSSPMGRFIFHIMSALAEMERELIVERTRAGLAVEGAGNIGEGVLSYHRNSGLRPGGSANGRQKAGYDHLDVAVCTLYKKFPAVGK
jgi:DNA invertase Pin-like site-specific DNA recombinase